MVVFIDRRIVAKEYELVGVAPVAEGCDGLAAQLLPHGAKPTFGPLPRGVGPIKLVGAKRAVACGKQEIGDAEARANPAFCRRILVAVVAVGHESGGKIALPGHTAAQGTACGAGQQCFFVGLEAAFTGT